jgi:predicted nucleic acid-binding protein
LTVFVDANVVMYTAGREHPNRAPAQRFMERVGRREIQGVTSTEVLQELLYRYTRIGQLRAGCDVYAEVVNACIAVLPVELPDTDRALDLLSSAPGTSPRDAIHAAVMLNNDIEWIATFDRGFDRIPGIRRLPLP